MAAHRAQQAAGRTLAAQAGAQVHHTLGVGLDALLGQHGGGQGPELALLRGLGQVAVKGQHPGEHPFDVAVEDGHPLTKAESRNRGRGRSADAGQRGELRRRGRKAATVLRPSPPGRSGAGCAPGCSSPGRSTCASTSSSGAAARSATSGKCCKKARVVAQHRGHLGLLQHDLGQPDAVGIAGFLPGQAVAAVRALPGDQRFGKVGAGGGSAGACASSDSSPLASGAEKGRALALHDAADRCRHSGCRCSPSRP